LHLLNEGAIFYDLIWQAMNFQIFEGDYAIDLLCPRIIAKNLYSTTTLAHPSRSSEPEWAAREKTPAHFNTPGDVEPSLHKVLAQ
jgi:hypothetical protein